mgnify:CR=1 FL=1
MNDFTLDLFGDGQDIKSKLLEVKNRKLGHSATIDSLRDQLANGELPINSWEHSLFMALSLHEAAMLHLEAERLSVVI